MVGQLEHLALWIFQPFQFQILWLLVCLWLTNKKHVLMVLAGFSCNSPSPTFEHKQKVATSWFLKTVQRFQLDNQPRQVREHHQLGTTCRHTTTKRKILVKDWCQLRLQAVLVFAPLCFACQFGERRPLGKTSLNNRITKPSCVPQPLQWDSRQRQQRSKFLKTVHRFQSDNQPWQVREHLR